MKLAVPCDCLIFISSRQRAISKIITHEENQWNSIDLCSGAAGGEGGPSALLITRAAEFSLHSNCVNAPFLFIQHKEILNTPKIWGEGPQKRG